jgi:major membrane immunogen (membrane-anchored lipoprotein)
VKRIATAVGVSAVLVAALTGCSEAYPASSVPNTEGTSRLTSANVTLPDGRIVACVYGYEGGGVTCDFDHPVGGDN